MSNPNDGQKRYDIFIELVKEAYEHTHKKNKMFIQSANGFGMKLKMMTPHIKVRPKT